MPSRPGLRFLLLRGLMGPVIVLLALFSNAHAQGNGTDTTAPDGLPRAILTSLSYSGELVTQSAGGAPRGTVGLGAAGAQFTVLLGPLLGWPGARAFVLLLGTHGGAPSALVGDVQGVSNLQATPALRLEEAWLQQDLLGNRLSWLIGRFDLNAEFYRLQSAGLFHNSSFGIGPEFAQSGVAGPSIYPNPSVGARVEVKPSPNAVLRAAALDGVPVNRPGGGIHLFAPGDGALLVGEAALLARPDSSGGPRHRRFLIGRGLSRTYSGKLALGGWYYTARFPDLVDTLATGMPVLHRGSRGAYLLGDQTVWSAGGGRPAVLAAFAQIGVGDPRVNQIGGYLGGGLTLTGPFPGRDQDELSLAVAMARNGSHYERAQLPSGTSTAAETAVELTHLVQLGSWLALQPDAQYVIHPGGARGAPNALVLGLRILGSR
jgi:porin